MIAKFKQINKDSFKKYPFLENIISLDSNIYYRIRKMNRNFLNISLLQKKIGNCRVYKDLYIVMTDGAIEKISTDFHNTVGKALLSCAKYIKNHLVHCIVYDEFNANNDDGVIDKIILVFPNSQI